MKKFNGIYGVIGVRDDGSIDYSLTDKRLYVNIYEEEKKPSSEEKDVELEGFSLYGRDDEPRYRRGKVSGGLPTPEKIIGRRLAEGQPDEPVPADEDDLWLYRGLSSHRADLLRAREINLCPECSARRTLDTRPLFAVWRCPNGH